MYCIKIYRLFRM